MSDCSDVKIPGRKPIQNLWTSFRGLKAPAPSVEEERAAQDKKPEQNQKQPQVLRLVHSADLLR
jgi:hypothetical protein